MMDVYLVPVGPHRFELVLRVDRRNHVERPGGMRR